MVVDDEREARRGLCELLAREADVEVVAEVGDGDQAVRLLTQQAVDLVLLDIQMPRVLGFDVVAPNEGMTTPLVIFVTAHDQYALRAFELGALDYLVKPYREERLREALQRARERLQQRSAGEFRDRLEAWLTDSPRRSSGASRPKPAARIRVEHNGRIRFVAVRDILWIEAQDYCVLVHLASERILRRGVLKQFLEEIDPRQFVRVHRSAAVNVRAVRELVMTANGGLTARLTNEQEIPVARPYRHMLEERLRATL
jgi:two-component system LytT family response regulator